MFTDPQILLASSLINAIWQVETIAEGHVFAEKSGLGSEALHKFFEAMFPGPYAAYSTRMMTGDYMRDEVNTCHSYVAPGFLSKLA